LRLGDGVSVEKGTMSQPVPEQGRPDLAIAFVIGFILLVLISLLPGGFPFALLVFGFILGLGLLLDRCALKPQEAFQIPSEVATASRKRFGAGEASEAREGIQCQAGPQPGPPESHGNTPTRQEGIQPTREAVQERISPTNLPIANHSEAADDYDR